MTSGIEIEPKILDLFNEVKLKHTYKYLIFRISDDNKLIIIDDKMPPLKQNESLKGDGCKKCWDELCAEFQDDQPLYIIYDIDNKFHEKSRSLQKLIFVSWCSDQCKVNKKMVFAATTDNVKKNLVGVCGHIHASERSELEYTELLEVARKGK